MAIKALERPTSQEIDFVPATPTNQKGKREKKIKKKIKTAEKELTASPTLINKSHMYVCMYVSIGMASVEIFKRSKTMFALN